jgi:hypothetical protein
MFYTVLAAYRIFNGLDEGNWRLLLVITSIPIYVAFILCCFYLYESPRFLLANKRFDEGFSVLNEMGRINDRENFKEIS